MGVWGYDAIPSILMTCQRNVSLAGIRDNICDCKSVVSQGLHLIEHRK